MKNAALQLADRGLFVFALTPGAKIPLKGSHAHLDATTEQTAIEQMWAKTPDGNIGVHCGPSHLIDIDLDMKNGVNGIAQWEILLSDYAIDLPATARIETPTGGQHILLRAPEGSTIKPSAGKLAPGVDVRAGSSYFVAPPSVVETGAYKWIAGSGGLAECPQGLYDLLTSETGSTGKPSADLRPIAPGDVARVQDALTRLAPERVDNRDSWISVGMALSELGDQGLELWDNWSQQSAKYTPGECDSKWTTFTPGAGLTLASLFHWADQDNFSPDAPEPAKEIPVFFRCTDMGNGERLATWYKDEIRFCDPWTTWLCWDSKRWAIDETRAIEWTAKQAVRGIYAEASRCEDDNVRKAIGSWARASESGVRRREMIAAARSEPGIAITPLLLDADPWVLTVNNGVVDLRTGLLGEHDRDGLMTKLAPVDFDSGADCPLWLSFLDRIMDSDQEMIDFLQRAIGYTLTGDVSERALFILHGSGDNGKTTMLETIRTMLGDYAMSAEAKTLMKQDRSGASSDIARLKGARLVTASESEQGDKLAESLVKQLTGGDKRTARLLYQNEGEYTPTDKLWLGTNHRPEITGTDPAIWNRIKLIPFSVTIPKQEQDLHLKEKLEAELPGILAWAVKGCLDWQANGLSIPEKVLDATKGYRQESDLLGQFIDARCATSEHASATLKALYNEYMPWCVDTGEANMTKREFSAALAERGFTKYIGHANATTFRGIGLKAKEVDPLNF